MAKSECVLFFGLLFFLLAGCGQKSEPADAQEGEVAQGRQLFVTNGCAVCHGDEGRGDGRVARSLNPPPRDFRDLSAYKQGHSVEQMAATIRQGIVGGRSSMPAYPQLSEADSRHLALFIQSLREAK